MTDNNAYQKIVNALKHKKTGVTAADVCAATALPLEAVRGLLPKAADEYNGNLQVTQSGEILYSFPDGFTSRYRGFNAFVNRAARVLSGGLKTALVFIFKFWIMLMLIGYFTLFLALAAASVVLSVVVQSKSSDRGRGNVRVSSGLFQILWRIWFINEITRPRYGRYPNVSDAQNIKKSRPMHKAVFSFVFGEDDPNKNYEELENKAVISYIQANRGVISLAEYMALSGKDGMEADAAILAFCSKYGGSPEATEAGTLVFRFDDLLLSADTKGFLEPSPPVKRLKTFSFNKKSMNACFIVVNAVNLLFGSYFLYHAVNSYKTAPNLYAFTFYFTDKLFVNPNMIIGIALGVVPLAFSFFFWLIPAVRKFLENKENEKIKFLNFKKFGFSQIWKKPENVNISDLDPQADESRPKNLTIAADRVIKNLGAFFNPQVNIGEDGKTYYSFNDIKREKEDLANYRDSLDPRRSRIGGTVFDSGK